MTQITLTRVAKKRSTYAERSGQGSRAAASMSAAFNDEGPKYFEDRDGNMVRQWTKEENAGWRSFSIAPALRYSRVIEVAEMLREVPLATIKAAICQGWIKKAEAAPYYWVTTKGAKELELPKKDRMGRTLKFLEVPADFRDHRPNLMPELAPLLPVAA
jgi:hypothetical protein